MAGLVVAVVWVGVVAGEIGDWLVETVGGSWVATVAVVVTGAFTVVVGIETVLKVVTSWATFPIVLVG